MTIFNYIMEKQTPQLSRPAKKVDPAAKMREISLRHSACSYLENQEHARRRAHDAVDGDGGEQRWNTHGRRC